MQDCKLPNELKRIILAFGYSFQGLKAALGEAAFRIEAVAAALALPLAFMVSQDGAELALLIGSVFLVLIVELLNTAIESAIDRISLERHELSKIAKDLGSAAVLLSLANAAIIWLIVLWT